MERTLDTAIGSKGTRDRSNLKLTQKPNEIKRPHLQNPEKVSRASGYTKTTAQRTSILFFLWMNLHYGETTGSCLVERSHLTEQRQKENFLEVMTSLEWS